MSLGYPVFHAHYLEQDVFMDIALLCLTWATIH